MPGPSPDDADLLGGPSGAGPLAGRDGLDGAGGAPRTATVTDEVDRIVEAWQRERPDLDVSPLHVLSRVSRLARHLDLARRAAFSEHGLEPWSFDVLSALRRAGHPYQLTPGQLLTSTLVTSGTMTNRVDRLAATGLVERHPDPGDRRGVLVRLTATGADRVDAALADLVAREHALLASLDDETQAELAGTLRGLVARFDAPGAPVAAGGDGAAGA